MPLQGYIFKGFLQTFPETCWSSTVGVLPWSFKVPDELIVYGAKLKQGTEVRIERQLGAVEGRRDCSSFSSQLLSLWDQGRGIFLTQLSNTGRKDFGAEYLRGRDSFMSLQNQKETSSSPLFTMRWKPLVCFELEVCEQMEKTRLSGFGIRAATSS